MEQFRGFVENLPDFFKPWGEEILLRYFDFEGRTDRGTFWKVILINILIGAAFGVLSIIPVVKIFSAIISGLYSLAILIPSLAMQIRRLNDTGKSWPFIFFAFIPCVGGIILLIFYLQDSVKA